MVGRRIAVIAGASLLVVGVLGYLRDPAWLINETTGLRGWEQPAGMPRFRWSGGHASFFVPATAAAIHIPLSTTFDPHDGPVMVTISVDDEIATRVVLTDAAWKDVTVPLPPPARRRVRRIDLRTSLVREGNHGVRVGEISTTASRP